MAVERKLQGNWQKAVALASLAFTLFQLRTAAAGPLMPLPQRAVFVAFGFGLCFALFSLSKRAKSETRIPLWDLILIGLTVAVCANVLVSWGRYITWEEPTVLDYFLAATTFMLTIEITRRVFGWVMPIIAVVFVLYALFGHYVPGYFQHPGIRWGYLLQLFYQTDTGIWGFITGIGTDIVAIFVIFGEILLLTGGGQTIINLAFWATGRLSGGPALAAVVASGMFGTISGSAIANVVATGCITIPMMKRLGYRPEFAGGVEAAASTGGQIMPPIMGIGAFIMAELLDISYLKVIAAAAIPALLYYGGVFAGVLFEAQRLGLRPIPPDSRPSIKELGTWSQLSSLFAPIALLLFLLVKGYPLYTCAFAASMLALAFYLLTGLSWTSLRQKLGVIVKGLETTGFTLARLVPILVCANVIVMLVTKTGLGIKISSLILSLGGTSLLLSLILGAVVAIILSMGLPTTAAYLLCSAILATAFLTLGIAPLTAHLFIFYFACFGPLTPPVCAAVFAAVPIAQADWLKIAGQALKLAVAAYLVPFLFVYNPALLGVGSAWEIAFATIVATTGLVSLAAAVFGYLRGQLFLVPRLGLLLGAASIFVFIQGWQSSLIGVGLIIVALSVQIVMERQKSQRQAKSTQM